MCNFKIWFHSTGLAPEGDVFLSVTFPENSSLIQNFTATLTGAAADEERAKKMYLDTLAPGTVSPPVLLGEPQDDAKINIYILGLTKDTGRHMFLVLLLFFSMLLLCSFSGLQELFQGENGSTTFVFLVWKMSKIWVGQTTANREKKKGLTLYVNNTSVCMWTTPPLSVSHKTFLFI